MEKELSNEFIRIEDTKYGINQLGQVKNLQTENILSPFLVSNYPAINILHRDKRKVMYVHHLMSIVYLDHIPKRGLITINHIDHDKTNNRLDNLEIVSHRRNTALFYINKNRELPTGVIKIKGNKRNYKAQICYLGINRYLGSYFTLEEAHNVYKEASDIILKTGVLPDYFFNKQKYERFKK